MKNKQLWYLYFFVQRFENAFSIIPAAILPSHDKSEIENSKFEIAMTNIAEKLML